MSSIDFDEVLVHVGEKGKYQNIMYYLLCISATLPAAFLAFSQVFVSASPEHWCRIPELENLTGLMTLEERKALSLPYVEKSDGKVKKYEKCKMYDVNYTAIVESWLGNASREEGEDGARSTRSRLPPPPVGSPDWPVTKCRHGWIYDNRDYDSTLVTETWYATTAGGLPPLRPSSTSAACLGTWCLAGSRTNGAEGRPSSLYCSSRSYSRSPPASVPTTSSTQRSGP